MGSMAVDIVRGLDKNAKKQPSAWTELLDDETIDSRTINYPQVCTVLDKIVATRVKVELSIEKSVL